MRYHIGEQHGHGGRLGHPLSPASRSPSGRCATSSGPEITPPGSAISPLMMFREALNCASVRASLTDQIGSIERRRGVVEWPFPSNARSATTIAGITSRDWSSYPILRFSAVPDSVEVDVIDRPGQPFLGTGEAAQGPTAAAIANALADAAGVRVGGCR